MKTPLSRLVFLVLALVGLARCTHEAPIEQVNGEPTTASSDVDGVDFEEYTARFEIYTLGTKRIFTDPGYHEQSPKVYLTAESSSTVHVTEQGVTWADLFASLPMSLDAECLVTGTGQRFCTNSQHRLLFELNGQEAQQALNQTIRAGDFLKVRYE